jgi:hypothetical protein
MRRTKRNRPIRQNYFTELVKIIREGGFRLFFQYQTLKVREILGYKSFKVSSSNICTTNNEIVVNREYQYREGSHLERVIVEGISFKKFFIKVELFFIDENRKVACAHTLRPFGYSGMWRLWDKGHYDIENWKKRVAAIDHSALDNLPVIELP